MTCRLWICEASDVLADINNDVAASCSAGAGAECVHRSSAFGGNSSRAILDGTITMTMATSAPAGSG